MFANQYYNCMTLGELRELVTTGKFSKFPNNTPIKICTDCDANNSEDVVSVIGDEDSINFYNF